MRGNNTQFRSKLGALVLVSWLLMILRAPSAAGATDCRCEEEIKPKLAQQVRGYDNGEAPLIPTLLGIADRYDLPMGIEKVTGEALRHPIRGKMAEGSVSQLLDLCFGQVQGYSWSAHDGVVHVYGVNELSRASNLFNRVVPSFEIRDQTLNAADEKLGMLVLFEVEKPKGVIGSYLPNSGLEDKRLTFVARNITVREILNGLVRLHGRSVWISRVSPASLSQLPPGGLWKILPHTVHDPSWLLEPILEKRASQESRR